MKYDSESTHVKVVKRAINSGNATHVLEVGLLDLGEGGRLGGEGACRLNSSCSVL